MDDQWYVYIIECKDGTYYTGITNNVDRRIDKHTKGKGAKYTRGRGPFILKHVETLANKSEALKREYMIKKLSKKSKIELWKRQKKN